jgi:aryl-alcohol dehydrogenase-like predicted oxidoreductase
VKNRFCHEESKFFQKLNLNPKTMNKLENIQQETDRRSFLKFGATLGAAILGAPAMANPSSILSNPGINRSRTSAITKFRTLGSGNHSLKVTTLGLGCMGMSYHRGRIPDRNVSIALIRKAYEAGVNFFDTAEVYGPYINEDLVGEALQPFRKEILVSTKFGFNIQNNQMAGLNGRPEQIRKVAEESLKRLRTDVLDLFYQHRQDPNVPIEDVAGTVKDLISEGKVRNFGLSEVSVETIRKAHAIQPLTAIQSEYHLMWKRPEEGVLAACEELGIGFVPYSPMNRGYLTGVLNSQTKFFAANDNRAGLPRFTSEAMAANRPYVELLLDFGHQRGLTPTQVALAWLLHQKPFIVPIPGTTKQAHLMENLAVADIQISESEWKEFDESLSQLTVFGDRYTPVEQNRIQN